MESHCLARQLAAVSFALGLAFLAGSSATARAEWPKLLRSSKPKITVTSAESQRMTSSPVNTAKLLVAQQPAAVFEEDVLVPVPKRVAADADAQSLDAQPLDTLVALGLERNPRLAKVSYAVESARGQAIQAGLYPNPTVSLIFDELLDKQGRSGVNQLPNFNQQIVTARKLRISQAAAMREVDQASWQVIAERYSLLADIRVAYFDALALQRRVGILEELVKLAEKSVDQTNRLLEAKQVARLDLIQLEVEAERLRAELESSQRELPGAYKRLAATIGVNQMVIRAVAGDLFAPLPDYDLDRTQSYVLAVHPQLQIAQWGIQRAQLLVKRAQVEPIPNLGFSSSFIRQNQNLSNDFSLGFSATVPLWNRNQGNIHSAEADLCQALQEIGRVENDLSDRVSTAIRDYASARRRAERYRDAILPRAKETYQLSVQAYQGGQFEYLRVLEAQRAVAQANLEYIRALGDAWKGAASISGLTIEDNWPTAPTKPANVLTAPAAAPQ